MRKPRKVGVYLDYFHKGTVCFCVALTVYGTSYLIYKGFTYYVNVKPQVRLQKEVENRRLLAEGSSDYQGDIESNLTM